MPTITRKEWTQNVHHFSMKEKWGDPYKMDRDLIYLLEYLRRFINLPFVIHCGLDQYGHNPKTRHWVPVKDEEGNVIYHYADAADFHILDIPFKDAVDTMLDILLTLKVKDLREEFPDFMEGSKDNEFVADLIGLGIYPHWNNPGFHLDTRGEKARWGAVQKKGRRVYVSFEEAYGKIR